MNGLYCELDEEGALVFRQLPLVYAECLLSLPEVLADEDEKGRARLFPEVYPDDPDSEKEWERFGKPELFALFAKQGEIVRSDLGRMQDEPSGYGYRLEIPARHRTAWMAALNAARLMLAEKHGISAAEMMRGYDYELLGEHGPEERELVRYRIDRMGELEEIIVSAGDLDMEGEDPA